MSDEVVHAYTRSALTFDMYACHHRVTLQSCFNMILLFTC